MDFIIKCIIFTAILTIGPFLFWAIVCVIMAGAAVLFGKEKNQ